MNKTEFLKEVSSMSREEIQKKLLEGSVNKKKVQPVIITPISAIKAKDGKKHDKK